MFLISRTYLVSLSLCYEPCSQGTHFIPIFPYPYLCLRNTDLPYLSKQVIRLCPSSVTFLSWFWIIYHWLNWVEPFYTEKKFPLPCIFYFYWKSNSHSFSTHTIYMTKCINSPMIYSIFSQPREITDFKLIIILIMVLFYIHIHRLLFWHEPLCQKSL